MKMSVRKSGKKKKPTLKSKDLNDLARVPDD